MRCLAGLLFAALTAGAQQPEIVNAKVETRALTGPLAAEFHKIEAASTTPVWAAYTVPMVVRQGQMCDSNSRTNKVYLEGPDTMILMFRFENKALDRVRTATLDCQFDAGGLPVVLLTGVLPAQSIELLSGLVQSFAQNRRPHLDSLVAGIALHRDPAADRAMESLVAASQPEALREKALFWMANARGRLGFEAVLKVLKSDPSDRMREKATFDMTLSKEPGAIPALIEAARNDRTPKVRSQALFWLAHKAGTQESAFIANAARQDPDLQVRRQAVFALKQIPNGQGIPQLIQLARTSPDPKVKEQAVFWLGQSKDPQATKFFEDILK